MLACAMAVAPLSIIPLAGCGSPIQTAYRTAGVTENTVNTALTAWAEYSVEREQTLKTLPPSAATNLVNVLAAEKKKVDAFYVEHEKAKLLYKTAVTAYYTAQEPDKDSLDVALNALNTASKTLVDFILSVIPKEKAKAAKLN